MWMFTCKVMRFVVVFAAALFVFGLVLQLPLIFSWLQTRIPTAFFSYLGLLAMLLSPLFLLLAAVVSSIPTVSHKLDSCQH
ncbi:MAG: hypothetical protein KDI74_00700 [Gammaproteobacteria bacterium]|nr:hypothetical protein [Gammaproteobacteria bacterium]HXK55018.1 hypothetical protein [Gammaproteobacteria bacterium]